MKRQIDEIINFLGNYDIVILNDIRTIKIVKAILLYLGYGILSIRNKSLLAINLKNELNFYENLIQIIQYYNIIILITFQKQIITIMTNYLFLKLNIMKIMNVVDE